MRIGKTARICWDKSMNMDNPWIALLKAWIYALGGQSMDCLLIGRLQNLVLGFWLTFPVMPSEGIQIINHLKHWTCSSTIGCQPSHVDVYDIILYSILLPSAVQQEQVTVD